MRCFSTEGVHKKCVLFKLDLPFTQNPTCYELQKNLFRTAALRATSQWGKVYAVLTDSKNMHAGILKKSKALSLRCKKVCHKQK